jgi:hypothetical protein
VVVVVEVAVVLVVVVEALLEGFAAEHAPVRSATPATIPKMTAFLRLI